MINNLESQFAIQDRREVYRQDLQQSWQGIILFFLRILSTAGIDLPRHAVLDRSLPPDKIVFEEQVRDDDQDRRDIRILAG